MNNEGNPLADLLAATLPEGQEPDEVCYWIADKRMGRFLLFGKKPRPLADYADSLDEKHKFLEKSKQLRHKGLGLDDRLTDMQQQERSTLNVAFQTLNGKGYKPLFRGSILMYGRSDKACVCQTDTVPLTA